MISNINPAVLSDILKDRTVLLLGVFVVQAILLFFPILTAALPKPAKILTAVARWLEKRLNRKGRSNRSRFFRGFCEVIIMIYLAWWAGQIIWRAIVGFDHRWIIEGFILLIFIDQGRILWEGSAIGRALNNSLKEGRAKLTDITGGKAEHLDEYGLRRGILEYMSSAYLYRVVSPMLFYIFFGLTGLFIQQVVHGLASAVGYPSSRDTVFGFVANKVDEMINFIPARLAGLMLIFASFFVPGANPRKSMRAIMADAGKHFSHNTGWVEAALAGALSLSLGGPQRYGQIIPGEPWMGPGRARLDKSDVVKGRLMIIMASLLQVLVLVLFILGPAVTISLHKLSDLWQQLQN